MNCIKNDIIQQYIDGECTPSEMAQIERHIESCTVCAARIDHQRRLASGIKKAMGLLARESQIAPVVNLQAGPATKPYFTYRKLAYVLVAACLILFVLIINHRKESANQPEMIVIESGFAADFDANRPVSQQQMIITIIDSDGNKTEYFE